MDLGKPNLTGINAPRDTGLSDAPRRYGCRPEGYGGSLPQSGQVGSHGGPCEPGCTWDSGIYARR
jgi:hypothetical protein